MVPYFGECYGNPSSIYQLGRSALEALDDLPAEFPNYVRPETGVIKAVVSLD